MSSRIKNEIDVLLGLADIRIKDVRNIVMSAKSMDVPERLDMFIEQDEDSYYVHSDIRLLMRVFNMLWQPERTIYFNALLQAQMGRRLDNIHYREYRLTTPYGFYLTRNNSGITISVDEHDKFVKSVYDALGVRIEIERRGVCDGSYASVCGLNGRYRIVKAAAKPMAITSRLTDIVLTCQE